MKAIAKRGRRERGAALAEYGLLLAGVTLVSLVAVSVLGGKVGGLIGSVATMLPGAFGQQNAPVAVGQLVETRTSQMNGDSTPEITLDATRMAHEAAGTQRLGVNLGIDEHDGVHLYQLGSETLPGH
jgi:Flp pilus assembly pilin Flp